MNTPIDKLELCREAVKHEYREVLTDSILHKVRSEISDKMLEHMANVLKKIEGIIEESSKPAHTGPTFTHATKHTPENQQ